MVQGKGIVVIAIAGYYFVEFKDQNYLCRGRGKLRKGASPLAGDVVDFCYDPATELGTVDRVHPRRNQLYRPAIANVDGVVIVVAAINPTPDLLLVDKLLALSLSLGLEPIVCVNKADLNPELAQEIAQVYKRADFDAVIASAQSQEGLDELRQQIGNRTVVLAGQSGVGKSHLTSKLALREIEIPVKVGQISAKGKRGKHTTRQVALLPLIGGGKMADTPGFSSFELEIESRELHRLYPDFVRYSHSCKFSTCAHIHEPDCAVKQALDQGEINKKRYGNYIKIYEELKEREAHRY